MRGTFARLCLVVCLPIVAFARPAPDPEPPSLAGVRYMGGPADPAAKAVVDTIVVLGPYGSGATAIGTFETPSGAPDWNGWTSIDETADNYLAWHADTFHAVNGSWSAWCGDPDLPSCGQPWDEVGGYGNNWNEILEWRGAVDDPAQPCTVTVAAVANLDTEPGYDYAFITCEKSSGVFVDLWSGFGAADSVAIGGETVYQPDEYIGDAGDEVCVLFRFRSDGGFSGEDCAWPNDGAIQLDDVAITLSNGPGYATDFEDGTLGELVPVADAGVGNFAALWTGLDDLDPCRQNATPQVAFIDDGVVVPGTGGSDLHQLVLRSRRLGGQHQRGRGDPPVPRRGPTGQGTLAQRDHLAAPGLAGRGPHRSPHRLRRLPPRRADPRLAGRVLLPVGAVGRQWEPGGPRIRALAAVQPVGLGLRRPGLPPGRSGRVRPHAGGRDPRAGADECVRLRLVLRRHGDRRHPGPLLRQRAADGLRADRPRPHRGCRQPGRGRLSRERNGRPGRPGSQRRAGLDPAYGDVSERPLRTHVGDLRPGGAVRRLSGPPQLHWRLHRNPLFDPWRTSGLPDHGSRGLFRRRTSRKAGPPPCPTPPSSSPATGSTTTSPPPRTRAERTSTVILPADTSGFADFADYPVFDGGYDQAFSVRALPTVTESVDEPGTYVTPKALFWHDSGSATDWAVWIARLPRGGAAVDRGPGPLPHPGGGRSGSPTAWAAAPPTPSSPSTTP